MTVANPATRRLSNSGTQSMDIRAERSLYKQSPVSDQRSAGGRKFIQIFDVRPGRAIDPFDLRIRGFDHVIFVRRVSSAAMSQPEVPRGQMQRLSGEYISRPGASLAGPEDRFDSGPPIDCWLGAN